MNPVEGLLYGLSIALSFENLIAALVGALAGTIIGVLPGLGAVGGAAVLLPLTFTLSPTAGVIMIAAIYYGCQYGGSTTSVLLNLPGEPAAVVATFDGYPMARKGRAGPALGIMAIGSFIAGTSSALVVAFFTPALAGLGLLFRSPEFFALTLGGLLLLTRLVGDNLLSGLVPMAIGLMLGTVGSEGITGRTRFTFGQLELLDGISVVVVAVGVYGVAELMNLAAERRGSQPRAGRVRARELLPSRQEVRRARLPWVRGTVVGFAFGLLPGPSATMSTFATYKLEKSLSKHPEEFGTGAVEGLAGPEAANNAAATSSIVPVLALGIPFSATLALVMASLMSHGITPGPLLATQHPEVFWGVIASMLLGNAALFVLNVPLIGVWVSLLRVPSHYLLPIVAVLALAGTFAIRHSTADLAMVVVLGLVGYFLRRYGFSLAPMLVGVVLSPLIEKHAREALITSGGDVTYLLWSSPIVITIWVAVVAGMVWPVLRKAMVMRARRRSVGGAPRT